MAVTLRPHQVIACDDIDRLFDEGKINVISVLPTGAGKTLVKAEYARRSYMNNEPCILIAHRDVLLEQISGALCLTEVPHSFICSDQTRADITNLNLAKFGDSWHEKTSKIIVVSVDTFAARIRKGQIPEQLLNSVKLWLMDETHHLTQNSKWGKCIDLLPNARGLGVTATPIRGDKKGLGREYDGYFDDMSVTTCMFDLIKDGRLTPYKLFAPTTLDVTGIKVTAGGDYNNKELSKRTRENGDIIGSAIDNYTNHIWGQPAITFCCDILHAEETAKAFNLVGIPSVAVSSKSKPSVRKQAIDDLRNGRLWNLINVDLFGEGFDAPAVIGVFMLRKTESYSLYKQQFGRCLRPADGKVYGYVFDHVGNTRYMMERFGLMTPHDDPEWTLERTARKSSSGHMECPNCEHQGPVDSTKTTVGFKQDNGRLQCPECGEFINVVINLETMNCAECDYHGPVKTVYNKLNPNEIELPGFLQPDGHLVCPDEDCQHDHTPEEQEEVKQDEQKRKKKKVKLIEITIDVIEALVAERDRIDKPLSELDVGVVHHSRHRASVLNQHVNRQNAQDVLRHSMQRWFHNQYKQTGYGVQTLRDEFHIKFNLHYMKAQTLSVREANELTEKIQNDLRQRIAVQ
jgi:superfamily II DNA or RNA helicase